MAEQQTPTFKLVLVGDGGTGKVCEFMGPGLQSTSRATGIESDAFHLTCGERRFIFSPLPMAI
jgi:hypothetical protein